MLTLVLGVLGLGLLFLGGEFLVRGAASLALRTGITPLAVGLTVVAFGTSAPELVVSFKAARAGLDGVAVGNVVGSNICNIGLILGLAAVVRPLAVKSSVLRFDAPIMLAAAVALWVVLRDGTISRPESIGFILGIAAYTAFTLVQASQESKELQAEVESEVVGSSPARSVLLVLSGTGALIVGGAWLVDAAVVAARLSGMSEAGIGLTIVAVGTSLPELVTSVLASAHGQGDVAIGNVIGSNVFNVFSILGITGAAHPLSQGGVASVDIVVMIGLSALLVPLLLTGRRLTRIEGIALLLAYVVYVGWRVVGAGAAV